LRLNTSQKKHSFVIHDPCYISRYESGVNHKELRFIAGQAELKYKEPKRSGYRSFCCGAGGAQVFNEEGGKKRIHHERIEELLTFEENICTACPFCGMMLKDGLKDKGIEDTSRVKDIIAR